MEYKISAKTIIDSVYTVEASSPEVAQELIEEGIYISREDYNTEVVSQGSIE